MPDPAEVRFEVRATLNEFVEQPDGTRTKVMHLREDIAEGEYGEDEYRVSRSLLDGRLMIRFGDEEWHVTVEDLLPPLLDAIIGRDGDG